MIPQRLGLAKEKICSHQEKGENTWQKEKKEDPYDLCTCYEPSEPTPEEFIDPGDREPTLADTAFYLTDENGIEYYCCGNTKIKITEHFAEDGKSMGELLEDLIIREAKKTAKD